MNTRVFALSIAFLTIAVVGFGCNTSTKTTTPSSEPAVNSNTANESREVVNVYLVALEDAGVSGQEIGCGDSLVAVTRPASGSENIEEQIQGALEELLAIDEQSYGESGLYNALYQSELVVESVVVNDSGVATVELSGSIVQAGTCDTPRIQEQLLATISQFEGIDTVAVTVNGTALADVLSGEGQ